MTERTTPTLSIVVPVYNEAQNLSGVQKEITAALSGRGEYEVLYVDDGSTDNSFNLLAEIQKQDNRVRVIRFRRNFGQTAALSAGFKYARGGIIVPIDGDGQNDPADIPAMIAKLQQGYDIVSGWRRDRKDNRLTRIWPSRLANWFIGKITGVRLHDYGCTLKAYRAESLSSIRLYGEMHRFIPALAGWGGEKITEITVNHRPRTSGKTNYGLNRTFKVILDLITIRFLASFSTKPIYVFGGLGGIFLAGSILSGLAVLYYKFLSAQQLSMNRNPLLIVSMILMTTAVQFLLMGLLAEILVRTYHESQDRPIYVIEKILESHTLSEQT